MSSTVRASRWLQRLGSSIVSWLTGVSLVLASACAGSEDADRTHGGRASSTDTQSTRLSPRVVSPIDPGPFTENPCRLVPEDKLASFGHVKSPQPDVNSNAAKKLLGPGCTWLAASTGEPTIGIRIHTLQAQHADTAFEGLEGIYQAKKSGKIDHLQPLLLPGRPEYPAVVYGQASDINAGTCTVSVGLADDLTFSVQT